MARRGPIIMPLWEASLILGSLSWVNDQNNMFYENSLISFSSIHFFIYKCFRLFCHIVIAIDELWFRKCAGGIAKMMTASLHHVLKPCTLCLVFLLMMHNSTPVHGWNMVELEVFDVVEEVNQNFYELMAISQVSQIYIFIGKITIVLLHDLLSTSDEL